MVDLIEFGELLNFDPVKVIKEILEINEPS